MKRIHTHYDNLKVARDAPPEIIRAAYKTLSLKFHPDRNPGNSEASRIMAIINASFEVLSNPDRRRDHDLWISEQEARERATIVDSQTQAAAPQGAPTPNSSLPYRAGRAFGVFLRKWHGAVEFRVNKETIKKQIMSNRLLILAIILWLLLIYVGSVISFGGCWGSECIVFPTLMLLLVGLLTAIFLTHHELAKELQLFRYMAGLFLFVGLIDLGAAGVSNFWHKDAYYVVVTKNKYTHEVTRVREPTQSLSISMGYILAPLCFCLPEIVAYCRRKKLDFDNRRRL